MAKRKSPAAVALGRAGGLARRRKLTPEQRSESARRAALAKHGNIPPKPETEKWWGLFAFEKGGETRLVKYLYGKGSECKPRLRERAQAEPDRDWLIEDLDYDPTTRMEIVPKFEPDTAARLKALEDLQQLDADLSKGGR
jgi:hypothetical protein